MGECEIGRGRYPNVRDVERGQNPQRRFHQRMRLYENPPVRLGDGELRVEEHYQEKDL